MKKNPVFINQPIKSVNEDAFGITTYCNHIVQAINKGARMIAITSDFGAGKSSVINVLNENRNKYFSRHIIRISLWPKLCDMNRVEDTTLINNEYSISNIQELHSYLIYQMAKGMKLESIDYVEGKLSPSTGVLKISSDRKISIRIIIILASVFIALYLCKNLFSEVNIFGLSFGEISAIFMFFSVLYLVYIISYSGIVFSSKNSEGKNIMLPHEIFGIYNKYLINNRDNGKYLVVIEDLDRTNDNHLVLSFLKEIKKYYAETDNDKVVFLINIKPESIICENQKENEKRLYSKLFDYIVDLPKVNFDNYDYVLNSILQEEKDYLSKMFDISEVSIKNIPEMEWIIRGKKVNIRTIKDRLNKTFTNYESLKEKSNDIENEINFAKCAAAAYLKSEYEYEFSKTNDDDFENLLNDYISNKETFSLYIPESKENKSYNDAVKELISAKLIDFDYRMYYYNYPKNAKIYKAYEKRVINFILYEDINTEIEKDISLCLEKNPEVICETLQRYKRLGIAVKSSTIENNVLLDLALNEYEGGVLRYLETLNYNDDSEGTTVSHIIKLILNSIGSIHYNQNLVDKYVEILKKKCSTEQIYNLRSLLCNKQECNIILYKKLFNSPYKSITKSEMESIEINDVINIANSSINDYSNELISNVLNISLEKKPQLNADSKEKIKELFTRVHENKPENINSYNYLYYMELQDELYEEYEKEIVNDCKIDDLLFNRYRELINSVNIDEINGQTLENIFTIDKHDNYSNEIAEKLYSNDYQYDGAMIWLNNNSPFDLNEEKLILDTKECCKSLHKKEPDLFNKFRNAIINNGETSINNYQFMFLGDYPLITKEELQKVVSIKGLSNSLTYINIAKISDENGNEIIELFNSSDPNNSDICNVIINVGKWQNAKNWLAKVDFDNKYNLCLLNDEERNSIKSNLATIFNVNSVIGLCQYSKATKYLDKYLDNNSLTFTSTQLPIDIYADVINNVNINSITNNTIAYISRINPRPYTSKVENVLYENGKYNRYVESKILNSKSFVIEEDKTDTLWETYIDLFNKYNGELFDIMKQNTDFISKIITTNSFDRISNEKFKYLLNSYQNSEIIQYVVTNKKELLPKYFIDLVGFIDRKAARTALDIIINNKVLLESDDVYNNIYDKLVGQSLKNKYDDYRKNIK